MSTLEAWSKGEHGLLRGLERLRQRESGLPEQKTLEDSKSISQTDTPSISQTEDMVSSLETEPQLGCPMAPAALHSSSRRSGKGFPSNHKPRGQGEGQT